MKRKRFIHQIINSIVVPAIFLISELVVMACCHFLVSFTKPYFFILAMILLGINTIVLRWEVKLIFDVIIYLLMAALVTTNAYYLMKAGTSNINLYEFTQTPYFKNHYIAGNLMGVVLTYLIGFILIIVFDYIFRADEVFVIETNKHRRYVTAVRTPVYVCLFVGLLSCSFILQVSPKGTYNDISSFIKSSVTANKSGITAFSLDNIMHYNPKGTQIKNLYELNILQTDEKGNEIPITNDQHLLYTPNIRYLHAAYKTNYCLINVPGLVYEPLNEIHKMAKHSNIIKNNFIGLIRLLDNGNVYPNCVNSNPIFISEQQLFIGHSSSHPLSWVHNKGSYCFSLPFLLKQDDKYDTYYLTGNNHQDYFVDQSYQRYGYTDYLAKDDLSNEVIKNKEQLIKDKINIIDNVDSKDFLQQEINELTNQVDFLKHLLYNYQITDLTIDTLPSVFNAIAQRSLDRGKKSFLTLTSNCLDPAKLVYDNDYETFKEIFSETPLKIKSEVGFQYFYGLSKLSIALEKMFNDSLLDNVTICLCGTNYDYPATKLIKFLQQEYNGKIYDDHGTFCLLWGEKGKTLQGFTKPFEQIITPYMVAPEILYRECLNYPVNLYHGIPISKISNLPDTKSLFQFSKFYNRYFHVNKYLKPYQNFKKYKYLDDLNAAISKQLIIDRYYAYGITNKQKVK